MKRIFAILAALVMLLCPALSISEDETYDQDAEYEDFMVRLKRIQTITDALNNGSYTVYPTHFDNYDNVFYASVSMPDEVFTSEGKSLNGSIYMVLGEVVDMEGSLVWFVDVGGGRRIRITSFCYFDENHQMKNHCGFPKIGETAYFFVTYHYNNFYYGDPDFFLDVSDTEIQRAKGLLKN